MSFRLASSCLAVLCAAVSALAQDSAAPARVVSGVVLSQQNELVSGVTLVARSPSGVSRATSDSEGAFRLVAPDEDLTLSVEGQNLAPWERRLARGEAGENLQVRITLVVAPVHESVVIVSSLSDPGVERRNGPVFAGGLFSRDDQLFHTLNAGINAGQHEGGGKSLEVRRFGFNADHGGGGGGLKVLVDDVQQNQATQGHGQGYLGSLKSLTPELVEGADILNGPFSAEYGDFSGLGVVHIRTRESLPDVLSARLQGGSFDSYRGFLAYSPALGSADAFVALEASRTNGPFVRPLRYRRTNLTANYTRRTVGDSAVGFKLNAGSNDFNSSGQLPLDEVFAGRLDRFGFVDPDNGGRVRAGTFAAYYRTEGAGGSVFKIGAYATRSLFDLWSNFTFFLNDPEHGDEIQQHDSRLQEGLNAQYLRPFKLSGARGLLVAGGGLQAFQTNVGLYPSIGRSPDRASVGRLESGACPAGGDGAGDALETACLLLTGAHANVTNAAGYVQQSLDLLGGRLHLVGGLRYDHFRFGVEDRIRPALSGAVGAGRVQPKAGLAFTPSSRLPLTLHFNYGRGISSQDARGVVRRPESPRVATTDFYQAGTSSNYKRFSLTTDLFLIDQSNQQTYVPDDGSIEFAGPSRAYGFEVRNSFRLTGRLSFDGGLTRVMNAFYRGTRPREYVEGAPHTVANAGLTLSDSRGFAGSLRYRHASRYRLDPLDARVRASGLDVVDLYLSRRLTRSLDFNLTVDNLFDRRYFETQNYFPSRVRPGDDAIKRIHGTPGQPLGVTLGLTFRFFGK